MASARTTGRGIGVLMLVQMATGPILSFVSMVAVRLVLSLELGRRLHQRHVRRSSQRLDVMAVIREIFDDPRREAELLP
jgi:hypothetical protein